MKRLILALALITTINPALAVDFVFAPDVKNGDRPIAIKGHGNAAIQEKDYPPGKLIVSDEMDAKSEHEYDYVYQDGRAVYSPQKTLGPAGPIADKEAFRKEVLDVLLEDRGKLADMLQLTQEQKDKINAAAQAHHIE